MSASTIWSRTEGVYSLTVTILARLSGCLLVAASVNLGACAQVDARGVGAKKITITVSAAASLSTAYKEIGKQSPWREMASIAEGMPSPARSLNTRTKATVSRMPTSGKAK